MVGVPDRLKAVRYAQQRGLSLRRASWLLQMSRSMLVYQHRQPDKDAALLTEIRSVSSRHPSWGYRLVGAWLRENEVKASTNRVRRLWQEHGFSAHWRKRKRKIRTGARLNPVPHTPNRVWCMDFAEDRLESGRRFQTLLVKDEASAFCIGSPVEPSFKGIDVERHLHDMVMEHGMPDFIRCDNGSQFIAFVMQRWAERNGICMAHIDPGKPWQNGAAESLVAAYRREVLNAELFYSVHEAQVITDRWRRMYNEERPHSRLNYRPPASAYKQMDKAA